MSRTEERGLELMSPGWETPQTVERAVGKEIWFKQALMNTGRIEQLEAGQEGLKKLVTAWLRAAESGAIRERSRGERDSFTTYIVVSRRPGRESWARSWEDSLVRLANRDVVWQLAETETRNADRLSEVGRLFSELKEDFEDIGQRIARCALLEESLGGLENELEGEEAEYLSWCVSLVRDVLDYNYAEDLTKDGLDVLGKAIGVICRKGLSCDREDYRELHKELLGTGLVLLPTSRKAQEKYGQKESADGGEELLFPRHIQSDCTALGR